MGMRRPDRCRLCGRDMKRHKTYARKILVVLLTLLLAFIWIHSMAPAEDSAEESRRVSQIVTPFLELFVGEGNVTDHLVRKLAHFCEYGVLGILTGALLLVKGETGIFRWSYALLCTLAVAVIDESIQILAADRGAQVQDVLLDTAGSLTGLLAVWLIAVLARWLRHRDRTASQ